MAVRCARRLISEAGLQVTRLLVLSSSTGPGSLLVQLTNENVLPEMWDSSLKLPIFGHRKKTLSCKRFLFVLRSWFQSHRGQEELSQSGPVAGHQTDRRPEWKAGDSGDTHVQKDH